MESVSGSRSADDPAHISDRAVIHESVMLGRRTRVEPGAVIYENCTIGNDCIIGANAVLRPGTRIGNNTIFGPLAMAELNAIIGNNTTIMAQCHITMDMSIGDCVFVGPFVVTANTPRITEKEHGTSRNKEHPKVAPPRIEDHVRVGTGVAIMPGVVIGHHSLIAARCTLTKSVPANSFVIGGKDQIGRVA